MYRVNYFFEEIKKFQYGLPKKDWVKKCLSKEGWKIETLNFIFCSDKYLKKVNKKYLKKSYLTDVISFRNTPPDFIKTNNKNNISGDIFISIDRVKENQKIYKTIFVKELKRVMIHGALHLIGFNDLTKKERDRMAEKENIYIELE